MPTPEALDLAALLAPIPGDDPAGGSVPFTLRERLDQARKEINPDDFRADDPMRPAEAKQADWTGITALTTDALARTAKDLMLTARLTESETRLRGFAGLRDSLRLIRRLVEEAWDRLRPPIEEPDDLEVRAAALNWLDDADRGARFPFTIRTAPLIVSPIGALSWQAWSQNRASEDAADRAEKIVAATPREACQEMADDLDEVVAELTALLNLCNDKMGAASPSLFQVRQAVVECHTLAHQVLERKGPATVTAGAVQDAEPEAGETGGGGGSVGIGRIVATRAQAYQRLVEVADALEAIEPHSPIPHLVRRAVALGQLSFTELMRELIRDAAVLNDMSRNLGIKELEQE